MEQQDRMEQCSEPTYGSPDRLVRVGVISDTHVPDKASRIPGEVLRALDGVDVILHGGDLITTGLIAILQRIAPLEAVYGNNDPKQVVDAIPAQKVVRVGGAKIGLVHGHRGRGRNTPDRAVRAFHGQSLDALVFGHSHLPIVVPAGQNVRMDVLFLDIFMPTTSGFHLH